MLTALAAFALFVVSLFSIRAWSIAETPAGPRPNRPPTSSLVDQESDGYLQGDTYLIGLGKGDITGPVVEINFMGYADPGQLGTGVRQRLYSRAFIIGNPENPRDRVVYLVLDTQSGDTAVRNGVLEALEDAGPEYAMYGRHNIALTATHSHSGPGAWLNYLLPQITSKGFNKPSYQAIVDGAVKSIKEAHARLAPGRLSVGSIDILDANVNRSPWSYLANPAEERQRYKYDADKTMTVLRFSQITESGEAKDVGVFTWYATHGTSVLANNTLVSGDNKGLAAYFFEQSTNDPSFVAGFSQANVGDVSPNILGAYCEYGPQEGELCDFETSLCGGRTNPCHSRGPYWGRNDAGTASCYEIGRRQYEGARRLFDDPTAFAPIRGQVVKSFHQFVDFSQLEFTLANGTVARTCPAALGYSFAAGTSDWPGSFDFKQGQPHDHNANPLWSVVGNRIAQPNETQKACHREKPILLDVGESESPYAWSPNIVDIQLFRIGHFFIIAAPGEASTMAGRRWREAIHSAAADRFSSDLQAAPLVVLGGLANTYAHYIVTPEEYTRQRFEGASTLFGPWTLDAHIHLTLQRLPYLARDAATALPPLAPGPYPPINVNESLNFITPVVMDRPALFKRFGDVVADVRTGTPYAPGDTVAAKFVGANPRNNFRLEGTFAAVEKLVDPATGRWEQVRDDADWSLVYEWRRTSTALGTSQVTISWETKWETGAWREDGSEEAVAAGKGKAKPGDGGKEDDDDGHSELRARATALDGTYRIRYYGDAKAFKGQITAFEGTSGTFTIA